MSDLHNALLLACLQRHGSPITGDELLDIATGMALDAQWTTESLRLDPKSVAARLSHLKREGKVKVIGLKRDPGRRADTPVYEPTAGWNPHAHIPSPQRESTRKLKEQRDHRAAAMPSDYEQMSPRQLRTILEVQDMVLESTVRMIQHLQAGLSDMAQTREKARLRLVAEGLEPR